MRSADAKLGHAVPRNARLNVRTECALVERKRVIHAVDEQEHVLDPLERKRRSRIVAANHVREFK